MAESLSVAVKDLCVQNIMSLEPGKKDVAHHVPPWKVCHCEFTITLLNPSTPFQCHRGDVPWPYQIPPPGLNLCVVVRKCCSRKDECREMFLYHELL